MTQTGLVLVCSQDQVAAGWKLAAAGSQSAPHLLCAMVWLHVLLRPDWCPVVLTSCWHAPGAHQREDGRPAQSLHRRAAACRPRLQVWSSRPSTLHSAQHADHYHASASWGGPSQAAVPPAGSRWHSMLQDTHIHACRGACEPQPACGIPSMRTHRTRPHVPETPQQTRLWHSASGWHNRRPQHGPCPTQPCIARTAPQTAEGTLKTLTPESKHGHCAGRPQTGAQPRSTARSSSLRRTTRGTTSSA